MFNPTELVKKIIRKTPFVGPKLSEVFFDEDLNFEDDSLSVDEEGQNEHYLESPGTGEEQMGQDEFDSPGASPPAAAPAQAPTDAPVAASAELIQSIHDSVEAVKSKLDLLEAHVQTMEQKTVGTPQDSERVYKYFSFLNEKLDHLEAEHAEIERLIQSRR